MAAKVKPKVDPWDEIEREEQEARDLPGFATEEEKAALADRRAEITVREVRTGVSQFGDVWYLDCLTPVGERTITLSAGVPARDALIAALAERTPIEARFVRRNRTYWLVRP